MLCAMHLKKFSNIKFSVVIKKFAFREIIN